MATREEAIAVLKACKEKLDKAETKKQVLEILSEAGKGAGYKPAFRALVMETSAEESVRY